MNHTKQYIDMESLSAEQAEMVRSFANFLRQQDQREILRDIEWSAASEASFESDWDNEEDAIYDNWTEHYEVQAG